MRKEEIRTLTTRAPSGSPNVRVVELDPEPTEVGVPGAPLDKQRATPDPYPLSVNALRRAGRARRRVPPDAR